MKKTVLIYWPKKGNVENTAAKLAAYFDKDAIDMFTISEVDVNKLPEYDFIIIGGSTIGADNWEDTHTTKWYSFFESLKNITLKSKKFAIYGLGDQILYPDHYVDGMSIIRDEFTRAGAEIIGNWPAEGYEHTGSKSQEGDHFIGLALDDDQQPELSNERIDKWIKILRAEVGF